PKAITGTECLAQFRTTSWISDVSCAITTASGGCVGSQVVVWACCSRTAKEVISRLPNRAASASTAPDSACGSGRFTLPDIVVATPNSSRFERTVAKDIRGVKRPAKTKGWMDDDPCRRRRPPEEYAAAASPVPVVGDADRTAMDRL